MLRSILRALRHRQLNIGADTFAVESPSSVTINLVDYTVTVRSELAIALREIEPSSLDLIRDCLKCRRLFWAGRIDKKVCDKDAGNWRKAKQRRRQRAEGRQAEQDAAERQHAQVKAEAAKRLSRTAVAVLNAIVIEGKRIFLEIDVAAWRELKANPLVQRPPNPHIVRRTLTMLVRRGYLRHIERAGQPRKDRYEPRQKLINLW